MAKDLESTMRWKLDIKELKAGMQEAKRSISLANAEFKQATSGLSKWQTSTQGVEAKLKQLNSTLGAQKTVLNGLKQQYEITARELGETSPEAEKLAIQIKNQEAAIGKTERQISEYNQQLNQMNQEQRESETEYAKLNKSIEEQEQQLEKLKQAYANAVLQYGKNSDEANSLAREIEDLSGELQENKTKMKAAEDAADDFDKSMEDLDDSTSKASDGFTVMKGALASLVADGIRRALDGLKELARATYEAGSNFEASMSQVEAISGATGDELEALTNKAKEMGAITKFSATESAEAFNYMAMAGWKTEDMINGIAGIMNLAAASGEDLATTSDIVTDALTAMGYSAGDAGQLADVMAAASSNANTNVGLMGATFQYAAPIVGALGYSMEDTAVAIGLMANAGIKGEKAGTALRSVLTRLSAPPKEAATELEKLGISLTDSTGKMKPMSAVVDELRTAFSKMGETEQTAAAKHIAGQEAMSGLLAIVRAAPSDYEKLTKAVANSAGAAEKMSATMVDNVAGDITLLKSKIEGIMIKVFEKASRSIRKSLDTVSKTLDKVDWDKFAKNAGDAANKVAELFAFITKNSSTIMTVLKAIATAFVTYGAVKTIMSVVTAFQTLTTAIKAGETAMAIFTTGLNPVALGIAAITAVVVGATTAYKKHQDQIQENIEAEYGLTDAQLDNIDTINDLKDSYDALDGVRQESMSNINAEYGYILGLKNEYNSLIDSNGKVKKGYEDRANFILTKLAEAMGMELDEVKQLIDKNGQLTDSIDKVIEKKRAQLMLQANEEAYTEAIQNQANAYGAWQQAIKDTDEAQKKYRETQEVASEVMNEYQELLKVSPKQAAIYKIAHQEILDANEEAKKSYEEEKKALEKAQSTYEDYQATIKNYEGLSAAIIADDTDKINLELLKLQEGFKTSETSSRETLEAQRDTLIEKYFQMQEAVKNGASGITEENLHNMAQLVKDSSAELSKLDQVGQDSMTSLANGMNTTKDQSETAAAEATQNILDQINTLPTSTGETGTNAGLALSLGLGGTKEANTKAVEDLRKNNESVIKKLETSFSGTGTASGSNLAANLKGTQGQSTAAANTLRKASETAINPLISIMGATGTKGGTSLASGINSKRGDANTAGKNIANKAKSGMDSVDTTSSGENAAKGFATGASNKGILASIWEKGKSLAKKFLAGIKKGGEEGSPWKTTFRSGVFAGEGFTEGIESMMNPVQKAAEDMAKTAVAALSISTKDIFSDFGEMSGKSFTEGLKDSINNASNLIDMKSGLYSATYGLDGNKIASGSSVSNKEQVINFNQTINSPKAVDRLTLYRETNGMLFNAKVGLKNV